MTPTPAIDLGPVAPELFLVATGILLLVVGVLPRRPGATTRLAIALGGVALAAIASLLLWHRTGPATVLAGAVAADRFGVTVRLEIGRAHV